MSLVVIGFDWGLPAVGRTKASMMKRTLILGCWCLGVTLAIAVLPIFAAGQAAQGADESAKPAEAESAELETATQPVKVEGSADDGVIAERLRSIYEASGRYEDLSLRVQDGIVFIAGRAERDEHKQWASDLARRTEDVVAVVNDLEVVPPPVLEESVVRGELVGLWRSFVRALPLIGVGLLLLIVAVVLARLVSPWVARPVGYFTDSRLLRNVFEKLVALVIVVMGLVLFLQIGGLTGVALTVLSGTGLFGLVLGFAFRDIAENFLASILLSVQTPFRLGDVIEVEGYTGVVQKVTPRGTVLVDFDGNHIQIANATVYKSTLKNLTANPKVRLHFSIGIGYDTSVKHAQETAMRILTDHPAVLDDPEPMVLVDELGASTINLKVYFWIDGHQHSVWKMKSAMIRRVLRGLEQSGVSMPDEAREIIFPDGVPLGEGAFASSLTETQADEEAEAERKQERCREVAASDLVDDATEAEGDLTSEVEEIKRQAAASRDPEEGPNITDE